MDDIPEFRPLDSFRVARGTVYTGPCPFDGRDRSTIVGRVVLMNERRYRVAGYEAHATVSGPGIGAQVGLLLEPVFGADDGGQVTRLPAAPQLPAWSFQPDADMPGLYLQCETYEQRDAILRLLGAPTELIVKR